MTATGANLYTPRVANLGWAVPGAAIAVAPEPAAGGEAPATVFSQQLCEVQLLLDFVSGNPARRLPDRDAAVKAGLPPDWVEQVCQISWPPPGGAVAQADEEALLVKVKDYLNALASPASGASVAFTLFVAQEDNAADSEDAPDSTEPVHTGQTARAYSRNSLARIAFPGLVTKARRFRAGMLAIGIALSLWLLLTCLLSWYVALGNARLGQYTAAVAALDIAAGKPLAGVAASPAANAPPAPAVAGPDNIATCALAGKSATPLPGCGAIARAQGDVLAARIDVRNWLVFGKHQADPQAMVIDATTALGVLGAGVLPVFYGILGAGAAVLRLLAKRMRLSLLLPRDLTLALQQLALGAVVGACIGLFVNPPGAAGASVLGTVSLSSSALSFVAGFGVEAVFATLEALIARLFNLAPPPAPAPTAPASAAKT